MLDGFDDDWRDVDWDGLEEAALKVKRRKHAAGETDQVDPVPREVLSPPTAGLQPPTPSAMTLVYPTVPEAQSQGTEFLRAQPDEQQSLQKKIQPGTIAQEERQPSGPVPAGCSARNSAEPHHSHAMHHIRPTPPAQPVGRSAQTAPKLPWRSAAAFAAPVGLAQSTHRLGGAAFLPSWPVQAARSALSALQHCAADALAERRISGASSGFSGRAPHAAPFAPRQSSMVSHGCSHTISGEPPANKSQQLRECNFGIGNHDSCEDGQLPQERPLEMRAQQRQHSGGASVGGCLGQQPAGPGQHQQLQGGTHGTVDLVGALQQQQRQQQQQQQRRSSVGLSPNSIAEAAASPCMTPADLHRCIHDFRSKLPRLPLPPSSYTKCPGVFRVGHAGGCGADLRHVRKTIPSSIPNAPDDVAEFWGCTRFPDCDFRDVPSKRLLAPQVALEAASSDTFKVMPAQGAEQVTEHCGGLRAVLHSIGVNLSLASDSSPEESASKPAVRFPWAHYQEVVAALRNRSAHGLELLGRASLIPDVILQAHLGSYDRASDVEVEERLAAMPAALAAALLPFQREGVRFGLRRGGRVLIADEMGVGKTVQAVALASCYRDEWPLLVIVPASLRLVWAEELARWLPRVRPCEVHVIEGKTDRLQGHALPQVVITSYEMMTNLTCAACCMGTAAFKKDSKCTGADHCMAAHGFKVVIVDESHTLRTQDRAPDSRLTEAAVAAVRASARAVLLSGTPSLSRPFDLFRQVDSLRPGLLGRDRDVFAHRYCNRRLVPVFGRGGAQRMKWSNTGLAHGAELHSLLKQELMLRRLKREVMAQLPPKRRQVVRLPPPLKHLWPPQPQSRNASGKEGSGEDDDEGADVVDNDMGAGVAAEQSEELSIGQRTGLAKLPNVLEWLKHALGSGGRRGGGGSSQAGGTQEAQPKFLVFAHHKSVMAKIAAALEGEGGDGGGDRWAGAEYVRIEGSTLHQDRKAAVERFRDDPSVRVALLSVTAAGTGLDFSAASAVVFAELPAEVSMVRQAEDRAHRHGQRFPVNVYFLLARGTSDERRWQTLNRSLEKVSAVHDGGGGSGGSAADAAPGDSAGIALEAVCDVGGGHGWGCTQALPRQPPAQAAALEQETVDLTQDAPASLPAALSTQQGDNSVPAKPQGEGDAVLVRDSDDDEDGHPSPRGGPSVPPTSGGRALGVDPPTEGGAQATLEQHTAAGSTAGKGEQAFAETPATPDAAADPATADAANPALPDDRFKVWFEVSRHTNRVHFHGSEEGGALLGLSLPLDLLTVPEEQGTPQTILDLLQAVKDREGGRVVVGQAGLLALGPGVSAEEVEGWIGEARDFAAEWGELRAVHQNQLAGTPLRCPLQDALVALEARARAAGAYGVSTERQLDASRPHLAPPPGAELATVHVRYVGRANLLPYKQAFTADGGRLCIHCMKPVEACTAPASAVLEGAADLFCSVPCEVGYSLRSGGASLRRALFKLERGRCQQCKLDCHSLVLRLRLIEKGTRGWKGRRHRKLAQLAPSFCAHGFKAAADRLVSQCLEGNAWHADHIRPVYRGGGLCQLENLRTLCVPCHQTVTKKQASERAKERRLHKQHTLDSFMARSSGACSSAGAGAGARAARTHSTGGAPSKEPKPRRQLKRLYSEDPPDSDFQPSSRGWRSGSAPGNRSDKVVISLV